MKTIRNTFLLLLIVNIILMSSCESEEPKKENPEEIITDVTLTFTSDLEIITAAAQDPDGDGPQDLQVVNAIELKTGQNYVLTLELENSIENESITEEIEEEDAEHMFFFAFTEGLFSNPVGNGNVDNRNDAMRYNDQDENGQPVGLNTSWTVSATPSSGTFRVILKHQPELKSSTSSASMGETDIDITWQITTSN